MLLDDLFSRGILYIDLIVGMLLTIYFCFSLYDTLFVVRFTTPSRKVAEAFEEAELYDRKHRSRYLKRSLSNRDHFNMSLRIDT